MTTNRLTTDNAYSNQENHQKQFIKANAKTNIELSREGSSHKESKPFYIPHPKLDQQSSSIVMTPIIYRTNINKATPDATTVTEPLKYTVELGS